MNPESLPEIFVLLRHFYGVARTAAVMMACMEDAAAVAEAHAMFVMAEVAAMERSNPARHKKDLDIFQTSGQKMKTTLTNSPGALHSSLGGMKTFISSILCFLLVQWYWRLMQCSKNLVFALAEAAEPER